LGCKITNFLELDEDEVYRSLIPKTIFVIINDSQYEFEETVSLYSQAELQDYWYRRGIYYLAELPDFTNIVSFDTIRPEKTYIGRPIDRTFKGWYRLQSKTIEQEACSAAQLEIARLLSRGNNCLNGMEFSMRQEMTAYIS
jgi:hypothetical protein